jgi:short-subunit dehydrogenase
MTINPTTRVVWITGASSGIGEAVAKQLASEGYTVAASARSVDKLQALASKSYGRGRIKAYPLDVTDSTAQNKVIEQIHAELGAIHIAILNAGTYYPDDLEHLNRDMIRKQFDLNVFSTMDGIQALLPYLRQKTGAQIAVVASVAGYRGLPHATGYGGTKAALINMTESLKLECNKLGIKLQLICPGFVKTPLTDKNTFPMPFLIDADQAARIISKGLKSEKFEIVFPWAMALMMKILRVLPNRLYFALIKSSTGIG